MIRTLSTRWFALVARQQFLFANEIKPAQATDVEKKSATPTQHEKVRSIVHQLYALEYGIIQNKRLLEDTQRLAPGSDLEARLAQRASDIKTGIKYIVGSLLGGVGLLGQLAFGTFSIVTMGATAAVSAALLLSAVPMINRSKVNLITSVRSTSEGFELEYLQGLKPKQLKIQGSEQQGNISGERLNQIQKYESDVQSTFGHYFTVNNKVYYMPAGLFSLSSDQPDKQQ